MLKQFQPKLFAVCCLLAMWNAAVADMLYVLTHSTEEPDRATAGLTHAVAAARAGHDVALWLTGEGVRLGVAGVAETLREPGAQTAAEMMAELAEGGVTLYCSRPCFERRQFDPDALRPGAEIADPEALAALVAAGRRSITL